MKTTKLYIFLLFACVTASCQPTLIAEFNDRAVVEAYLYAGTTPTVKVSKLIPFRDDVEFSGEDIDRLTVTITDDTAGDSWMLSAQGEGVYASADFTVTEGHTYSLLIPYNGADVTATTTVPPKPVGMAVSATFIEAMGFPGFSRADPGGGAEVTWENPDKDYYMLVIRNTETNPTPIFETGEDDDQEEWPRPSFRKEPDTGSGSILSQMDFSYYGWHDVILIRMQPEYVLLYSENGDTSSTLTEIHANVNNGYGIFTAVNTDTVSVKVVAASLGAM